ncbi:hypothetical protein SmJEL517_g00457 [Synchytrium microbalum]|uniref:VFL3 protein n=1 Tax=Synchytrium microbalum TaxID=1806994 RepID=A0A507CEF6_9FUNG|nr:uncharacterized protein SmJEL517_g00457 [Synchytrium microbalum]TPX37559.1 hypothetical protein SmJEL517_g00457 [Synchytrium microbalum]
MEASCILQHETGQYTLSIWHNALEESAITEQSLQITMSGNHQSWTGSFNGSYLEEMTRKTGNFKRFSVFVEMLTTPTISLDLLTHSDLLTLKKVSHTVKAKQTKSDLARFYLIMTYAVAFDRVHYPLPLVLASADESASTLRAAIQELKQERGRHLQEIQRLLKENDRLKLEVKRLSTAKQVSSRQTSRGHPPIHQRKLYDEDVTFDVSDAHEDRLDNVSEALLKKDREIERLRLELMKAKSTNLASNRRPSPVTRAPEPYKPIKSRPLYTPPPVPRSASADGIPLSTRDRLRSSESSCFVKTGDSHDWVVRYVLEREQKLREMRARSQKRLVERRQSTSSLSSIRSRPSQGERGRTRSTAPLLAVPLPKAPQQTWSRKSASSSADRRPQKRTGRVASPAVSYGTAKDTNNEIDKRLETLRNFLTNISL